jgi:MFS transporter, FLVCR family, feline leukemia virus subgroup C receptor-related protein
VIVVAGMAGSVMCGMVLDKTHRFKETTLAVYSASVVGMVIFTFTLDSGIIGVVYLSSIILGYVALFILFIDICVFCVLSK